MYGIIKTNINKDSIKYQFFTKAASNGETFLTYADFISLLKVKDKDFWLKFKSSLETANSRFPAYFWECPPISRQTINQPFEFTVTNSPNLSNMKQNYASFSEYFDSDSKKKVVSFTNLNKDAVLIAPMPKNDDDYKNISEFTKNASEQRQKSFWKEMAKCLEEKLDEWRILWLSTHGGGVPYLHVRIDRRPKYYSCEKYKNPNYKNEDFTQAYHISEPSRTQDFASEAKRSSEFLKNEILRNLVNFNAVHPEFVDLLSEDYREVKRQLINNIRQRPLEWEIRKIKTPTGDQGFTFSGRRRDYEQRETALIHKSVSNFHWDSYLNFPPGKVHLEKAFTNQEWVEISDLIQIHQQQLQQSKQPRGGHY